MTHIPVLLDQILEMARETPRPLQAYLDVTLGRGGHLGALFKEFPSLRAVAIDQDHEAVEFAQAQFADWIESQRLFVMRGNFHDITQLAAKWPKSWPQTFDFILADLGVSSPQLDNAERGFSFYADGPLDMRMDIAQELTAEKIVNNWSEDELRDLFFYYGEIQKPGKVVKRILEAREEKAFTSTRQLSSLIESAEGWRKKGQHPATRYFLALRMAVNSELEPLAQSLRDLVALLNPHGRLAVLTFHSLEDRIAKVTFKELAQTEGSLVNKKVKQATWAEQQKNPRARSAKLRVFEKGGMSDDEHSF